MAMSIIFTIRGIPQIYYGTEIAMTSTGDHGELRKDFPGGWQNDWVDAFTGNDLTEKEYEAQNFMKKILNWRKRSSAVALGDMVHYPVQDGIYVYFRRYESELLMVAINNTNRIQTVYPDHFIETIKDKTKGINILNDRVHYLSRDLNVQSKTALILELY
tara:strand:- start:85 stop:564 length:480 start_codon:yes stop_codon:yes gene_type:complete